MSAKPPRCPICRGAMVPDGEAQLNGSGQGVPTQRYRCPACPGVHSTIGHTNGRIRVDAAKK